MPYQYTINQTVTVCPPCEHLKQGHVCYGRDFVSGDYVCHHSEANEFEPLSSNPAVAAKQGELRARIRTYGRKIGKMQHGQCRQPDWCPLKREVK